MEKYDRIVKLHVPTMNRDGRKRKPLWWNKNIFKARKNKLRWVETIPETECCTDYLKNNKAMNRARKLIRKVRRKYEERMTRRVSVEPLKYENGNIICDDKKMVEILNNYFSSVYTMKRLENITDPRIMFNGEHMLEEVDLTTKGGMNKLHELNSEKSPGNDSIHPAVLNNIWGTVAHPLSLMFRMSLETGEVPQDCKMANVTPISKKR